MKHLDLLKLELTNTIINTKYGVIFNKHKTIKDLRMKKLLLFIILPIITSITSCTSFNHDTFLKNKESLKKNITVAVLPFSDSPRHIDSGINVSDAVTSQIIKIKNWNIVERTKIQSVLKEQALGASGLTVKDYNKIGKLLDADFLIMGSVSEYQQHRVAYIVPQTKLSVNMRIINTTNGELVGTGRYVYETGKNAWCGCCILGIYYLPIALFSTENIDNDLNKLSEKIVDDIRKELSDKNS